VLSAGNIPSLEIPLLEEEQARNRGKNHGIARIHLEQQATSISFVTCLVARSIERFQNRSSWAV